MLTYLDYGIDLKSGKTAGEVQTLCPQCSHTRKKKSDKCLSVNLDKKTWFCHHCNWAGGLPEEKFEPIKYEIPEWKNNTDLPDKVLKWFESRRISTETVLKLNITSQMEFMPQEGKEVSVIAFNYFFGGKLINVKYRDAKKNFKLYKGAELILYNADSLINANEIWIVEGEMDCLSLIEAGIDSVVSVPNGAGSNTSYLNNYAHLFDSIQKIHICTDDDLKGRELRETLAERFGKEKCDYVVFEGCKDANEYLMYNGKDKLKAAANDFKEFPLIGVFTIADLANDILDLYENGLPAGARTGMVGFDSLLSFHRGYITTITGIPGHGKSDFLDHLLIKLFFNADWRGAFYSPENRPIQLHVSKMVRKFTHKPWYGEYRLTREELMDAMYQMDSKFWFVKPEKDYTLQSILDHVALLKQRKGIDWFVIDAWNKLEHQYTESETKYIGQSLDKITMFCELHNLHCFIVAHPTKIKKEGDQFNIPTLYDISGSANFFNKTDNGITIYRDMKTDLVEVHVQKVKFSHWGEVGMQRFQYDKMTGLYIECN